MKIIALFAVVVAAFTVGCSGGDDSVGETSSKSDHGSVITSYCGSGELQAVALYAAPVDAVELNVRAVAHTADSANPVAFAAKLDAVFADHTMVSVSCSGLAYVEFIGDPK